jgi:hypothetical protein
MGKWLAWVSLSLLLLAGCEGEVVDFGEPLQIGEQGGAAIGDSDLMKEATSIANRVIRNGADCEAVKANIQEVNRKLDEIEAKLQTGTGKTAIEATRNQVKNIADACGAY